MIKGLEPLSTFLSTKVNSDKSDGRCVACLADTSTHGLCHDCQQDLPTNRWHCYRCALPLAFAVPNTLCGECQSTPPPFSRALIPWRYQFPIDGMIGRYKYHGQRKFARPLLSGLADYIEQSLAPNDWPDALVPTPMHWQRRWSRGFNQAADISEFLGRTLDVQVSTGLTRRVKKVKSQRGLRRAGRLANLHNVFEVCGPPPQRVAIVDDVVTTGATVRALAYCLKQAGVKDIQVWALARTPG